MEEITNPADSWLVDEAQQDLEYIESYNDSLKPEEPTEQTEEVDKFSDIGDVAREISNVVGGLQQIGSDIVTLPERAIDISAKTLVARNIVLTLTSLAFENPIETRTWWVVS